MCISPMKATLNPDGGRPIIHADGELTLPCGSCFECIKARAASFGLRCRHELSMHDQNCFLTLTYDDEHLPSHLMVKDRFKHFIRRMRENRKKKFNYIVSHEYGSLRYRPHHHCILFGVDFNDQKYFNKSPAGNKLFTSQELSEIWTEGFHSIGEANEASANYIASYALKGKKKEIITPDGEIISVADSMDISKRPGIGKNYLAKNYKQLLQSNEVLPRYYQKLLNNQKFLNEFKIKKSEVEKLLIDYENRKLQYCKVLTPNQKYSKITNHLAKSGSTEFRDLNDTNSRELKRRLNNERINSR